AVRKLVIQPGGAEQGATEQGAVAPLQTFAYGDMLCRSRLIAQHEQITAEQGGIVLQPVAELVVAGVGQMTGARQLQRQTWHADPMQQRFRCSPASVVDRLPQPVVNEFVHAPKCGAHQCERHYASSSMNV